MPGPKGLVGSVGNPGTNGVFVCVWLCFLCVWVRAEGVDKRQESKRDKRQESKRDKRQESKRDKRQGWQKGCEKVLSLVLPLLPLLPLSSCAKPCLLSLLPLVLSATLAKRVSLVLAQMTRSTKC
jgi:hypothetical protein